MGINIFLFVWFYLFYDLGDQFFYTRHLLGVSKDDRRELESLSSLLLFIMFSQIHMNERLSCFVSVRLGLGQSSRSCPQLQLHADPPAGVQEPAVFDPRLLCGKIMMFS